MCIGPKKDLFEEVKLFERKYIYALEESETFWGSSISEEIILLVGFFVRRFPQIRLVIAASP
jgi:hypothetical protein